MAVKMNQVLIT